MTNFIIKTTPQFDSLPPIVKKMSKDAAKQGGASYEEIEVIQFKREIESYYACNYINGETDKFTVNNDVWNTMGLEIKRNVKVCFINHC